MGFNNAGRTMNLNGARIYSRALSESEIQSVFNDSKTKYGL